MKNISEQSCAEKHFFVKAVESTLTPSFLLPALPEGFIARDSQLLRKTALFTSSPSGTFWKTYFERRACCVAHVGQDLYGLFEHDPECVSSPITTESGIVLSQGLFFFIFNDL